MRQSHPSALAPPARRRTPADLGSRVRVLVADADADARRVCAGYCDLFDFDCAVAANRRDAVSLIRGRRFDVGLVEIELAYGALEPSAAPPLIALAPLVRSHEAQRWLAAGFADVLAKPVSAARLFAAISGVIDGGDASRSWAPAV